MNGGKIVEIGALREKIDRLDDEIFSLLIKRIDLAVKIGEEKLRTGSAIRNEAREREILSRMAEKCDGFEYACIEKIYSEIFAQMRAVQQEKTAKI